MQGVVQEDVTFCMLANLSACDATNPLSGGANVGVGYRAPSPWCCNTVWGAYLFYDYNDVYRNSYNQLGVGVEALGGEVEDLSVVAVERHQARFAAALRADPRAAMEILDQIPPDSEVTAVASASRA